MQNHGQNLGIEQKERHCVPYFVISSFELGEQREAQSLDYGCFGNNSQSKRIESVFQRERGKSSRGGF